MANVELDDLVHALREEGVEVDDAALARVHRRLANPGGCHNCGSGTKLGVVRDGSNGYGIYTTCCADFVTAAEKPIEDAVPTRRGKRNG